MRVLFLNALYLHPYMRFRRNYTAARWSCCYSAVRPPCSHSASHGRDSQRRWRAVPVCPSGGDGSLTDGEELYGRLPLKREFSRTRDGYNQKRPRRRGGTRASPLRGAPQRWGKKREKSLNVIRTHTYCRNFVVDLNIHKSQRRGPDINSYQVLCRTPGTWTPRSSHSI
jgi:hypothetical protein